MWKEESNELREQKGKTWHTLVMVREKKKLVYIHVKPFTSLIIKLISESEYKNLMILYGKMTAVSV